MGKRYYSQTAAKVAESKRNHPEKYCPAPKCLWRTPNGGPCPRHTARKCQCVGCKCGGKG